MVQNDTPLTTLGLDSLMYLEAQTQLNHALGTQLTLMAFLGMDNITEIAQQIRQLETQ
jgi:acyl carrier protein